MSLYYVILNSFSAGLNLGAVQGSSVTLGLPRGAPVSGSATQSGSQSTTLSLGLQMSATITFTQNETKAINVTVPGCSKVTINYDASRVTFSGSVTANVEITGFVTFEAKLSGRLFGTATITYPIQQVIPITGSYSGATGTAINWRAVQFAAACPPGSACNPRTATSVETLGSSGSTTPGTSGSSTGTTGTGGTASGGTETPPPGPGQPVIVLPPGVRAEDVGQCFTNEACAGQPVATCTLAECVWTHDGRSWKSPDGVCHRIRR